MILVLIGSFLIWACPAQAPVKIGDGAEFAAKIPQTLIEKVIASLGHLNLSDFIRQFSRIQYCRLENGFFSGSAGARMSAVYLRRDPTVLVNRMSWDRVSEAAEALSIGLTSEQLAQLEAAIPADAIRGERYAPAQMAQLDSERA